MLFNKILLIISLVFAYILINLLFILGQIIRQAPKNLTQNSNYAEYYRQYYAKYGLPLKPKRQPIFNSLRAVDFMRRPGESYNLPIKDYKPKFNRYFYNVVRKSDSSHPSLNDKQLCNNCTWIPPLMYYASNSPSLSQNLSSSQYLFKRDSLNKDSKDIFQSKISLSLADKSKACENSVKEPSKCIENSDWMININFPIICDSKGKIVKCFCDVF